VNRIQAKLQEDKKLLSIYFTAGYPNLNDTVTTIQNLEKNGVDMIEIGLPFSDPLADGPTIQASSTQALHNEEYKAIFERYGLLNVFLITPQTSEARIRYMDSISDGFIYMVSSASTTGSQSGFGNEQTDYFKRIADLKLTNPHIIGFGISDHETFSQATQYAKGAIIGSAFIKHVTAHGVNDLGAFTEPLLNG
jgi:tryptophan synthase alpha subunit